MAATLEIVEILCGVCLEIVTVPDDEFYVECKCGDVLIDNRPQW